MLQRRTQCLAAAALIALPTSDAAFLAVADTVPIAA